MPTKDDPSSNSSLARPSSAAAYLFASPDERSTDRLGAALAQALEPGIVVALVGHLGAGKTRLVRAVALAAGVDRREINSPTFVLVHEYEGRWPIHHFDAYRLNDEREFVDLGGLEYFDSAGVNFVEWADRIPGVLPADHLRVEITTTGDTSRDFRLSAAGPCSERIVQRLTANLALGD